MTILILTHAQDIATDLVIRHLEKRGADFVRFNTDEFPQKVKLTIRFEDMGWKGQIKLPDRCLDTDEISAIWNRRPHRPIIDSAVTDPTLRTWGQEEAWHTLCIFWSMLRDRFWLNPIEEGIYIENNKWLQIIEAQRVGLMVPNLSLLSNDPVAIKSFCLEIGELAMKRIKSGLLKYPREGTGVLYTIQLRAKELTDGDFQRMRLVPVFVQRYIQKLFELRITVVENQVFACAIHSQERDETKHDWRSQIFTTPLKHEVFELSEEIANKCIFLTSQLKLHYGAIDMAITPNNEFVFFEINQNGEWSWVEMQCGLPISKAIADLLIDHS